MSADGANMPNNTSNGCAANWQNYYGTKNLRVLLVDDSVIEQTFWAGMLQRFGVETRAANNGKEAVDIMIHGGEKYDMILMDYSMPVMNGLEAIRMLRSMGMEIKIVGVGTAIDDEEMKAQEHDFFMAGADDYVTKPINIDEFASLLAEFDD